MAVAFGVVHTGRRDAVPDEPFGDGVEPQTAVDVLVEDALEHRRGDRAGRKAAETLAIVGLARVGVRASVDQLVAAGRPPAEERPSRSAWSFMAERTRI